ncbi:hypothetical protein K0B03_02725 [Patescibacteria group bacterium]|nr:hypothetical protein [Patescibacteria group bacterium]
MRKEIFDSGREVRGGDEKQRLNIEIGVVESKIDYLCKQIKGAENDKKIEEQKGILMELEEKHESLKAQEQASDAFSSASEESGPTPEGSHSEELIGVEKGDKNLIITLNEIAKIYDGLIKLTKDKDYKRKEINSKLRSHIEGILISKNRDEISKIMKESDMKEASAQLVKNAFDQFDKEKEETSGEKETEKTKDGDSAKAETPTAEAVVNDAKEAIDKYFINCKENGTLLRISEGDDQSFEIVGSEKGINKGGTVELKNTKNEGSKTATMNKEFLYKINNIKISQAYLQDLIKSFEKEELGRSAFEENGLNTHALEGTVENILKDNKGNDEQEIDISNYSALIKALEINEAEKRKENTSSQDENYTANQMNNQPEREGKQEGKQLEEKKNKEGKNTKDSAREINRGLKSLMENGILLRIGEGENSDFKIIDLPQENPDYVVLENQKNKNDIRTISRDVLFNLNTNEIEAVSREIKEANKIARDIAVEEDLRGKIITGESAAIKLKDTIDKKTNATKDFQESAEKGKKYDVNKEQLKTLSLFFEKPGQGRWYNAYQSLYELTENELNLPYYSVSLDWVDKINDNSVLVTASNNTYKFNITIKYDFKNQNIEVSVEKIEKDSLSETESSEIEDTKNEVEVVTVGEELTGTGSDGEQEAQMRSATNISEVAECDIESIEVPERYVDIIEILKETNSEVNKRISMLSLDDQILVENLGLGGDLSEEKIKEAKKVMILGNLETATALHVSGAEIASSLYAGTYKERIAMLDGTLKALSAQESKLRVAILAAELKERQREDLGKERVSAVNSFVENINKQWHINSENTAGQGTSNSGTTPESTNEELVFEKGAEKEILEKIDQMKGVDSINQAYNALAGLSGFSKMGDVERVTEFKREVSDKIQNQKKYDNEVKKYCESENSKVSNLKLTDQKKEILKKFFQKIIEIVNEKSVEETEGEEDVSILPNTPNTPNSESSSPSSNVPLSSFASKEIPQLNIYEGFNDLKYLQNNEPYIISVLKSINSKKSQKKNEFIENLKSISHEIAGINSNKVNLLSTVKDAVEKKLISESDMSFIGFKSLEKFKNTDLKKFVDYIIKLDEIATKNTNE